MFSFSVQSHLTPAARPCPASKPEVFPFAARPRPASEPEVFLSAARPRPASKLRVVVGGLHVKNGNARTRQGDVLSGFTKERKFS
jgi:hypothetical protein